MVAGAGAPYPTIAVDPPWPAGAHKGAYVRGIGKRYGAGARRRRATSIGYSLMTLEDIFALDIPAAKDAHLFLWVTAGFNRVGVGVQCAEAWGFDVVGEIVWVKPNFGLGAFPRPQHEMLLVCRRGKLPFVDGTAIGSVQHWDQGRAYHNGGKVHSEKPAAAYDLIERVSPGPYLEMFARQQRLGWDSWGWGHELVPAQSEGGE